MRKTGILILAFFYLGLSAGATVQLHYCMGRLVEWKLLPNDPEKCSNCSMKNTIKKGGCCKNERKQIKIEKDQKGTELSFRVEPVFFTNLRTTWFEANSTGDLSLISNSECFSTYEPPPDRQTEIYVRNCVFRI